MKGLEALEQLSKLVFVYGGVEQYRLIEKELKEYKAIEEELGIDLVTLFKALKNGIYFRNPTNNKINSSLLMYGELEISVKGLTMISMEIDILFYFKDYGKTWALTKEELKEN